MNTQELSVYVSAYKLLSQFDKFYINFPKEFKNTYGIEFRKMGIDMIKNICLCNNCAHNDKKRLEYLDNSLGFLETMKIVKRLLLERMCISTDQEAVIDGMMAEVGKQLNGWKKYTENYK